MYDKRDVVLYARHFAFLALWLGTGFAQSKPEVLIAAATNLTQVLREIGPVFESTTGIHPVLSFASTAQLAQQIEHGAPFDVFLAADDEHIDQLVRKGLLDAGSRA